MTTRVDAIELCTFVAPQNGADYDDVLAFATATEECGFTGFFRSDHLYSFVGEGLPGPTDAWMTLAGLARETTRIRLGTLVSSATFRHPGVLAIQVAGVDAMSGGRVELGLGAGWHEREHAAYGIPFPARRFGPFEEQLAVISGLWATPVGETFSFEGEHYRLVESPALPKPVQSQLPIIVGGGGLRRTPALAAAYAAEYNYFEGGDPTPHFARVREAASDRGRDPGDLRYSIGIAVEPGLTPAEVRRRVDDAGEAGADRAYLRFPDLRDLDRLRDVARVLLPHGSSA